MINRTLQNRIQKHLTDEKAIIIQGARQVGKTTLIRELLKNVSGKTLWVNGDSVGDRALWDNVSLENLNLYLDGFDFLVVDEAQRIDNIGLAIKMIIDGTFNVKAIVSGSSSLGLASSINEPLTGRKWSFELFPIDWLELRRHLNLYPALKTLDERLILGSYPEIVTASDNVKTRLSELASSYLYKDVLDFGLVRKPELIIQLLRALAYQVGSQVSYNELANMLQVSNETIRRYIQLLEESYVIFRLEPLSTNPRKEIFTSRKIYFFDNGIRNALIDNFSPLTLRNDQGILWENYVVAEFYKINAHAGRGGRLHYWRSKSGSEVDLIWVNDGNYRAYEIKYNPKKKPRFPASFLERYQPSTTEVINRENFYIVL